MEAEAERSAALSMLEVFCRQVLPSVLRRIAAWRGFSPRMLLEFVDDVRHELTIDCLEHAAMVTQLPTDERHRRWMRRAERFVYRTLREHRSLDDVVERARVVSPAPLDGETGPLPLPELVTLANGRPNLSRTARARGATTRVVRQQLDRLLERLGHDDTYCAFWTARVVEALLGLAADLLRDRGVLSVLRPFGRRADPQQRLRRLRRLSRRFQVQPRTRAVRQALRPWLRGHRLGEDAPVRLCAAAMRLAPHDPSVWLWRFEAELACFDAAAAAHALRRATVAGAAAPALALARARLHELRRGSDAAVRMLRRAAARRPREVKLVAALRQVTATPP